MDDNFRDFTNVIKAAKGAKRLIRDVELTCYGCYILVLSSDSSKPIVSHAKEYFAEQTRRQELADADTFAQLSEDEKRLIYRTQLSMYYRKLAQTAHNAGVVSSDEHAEFQNAGYRGLYGGLRELIIHELGERHQKYCLNQ